MRLRMERKGEVKPPYRVPSMSEIAALPWNGFTVVSTFSGCGGSCLGYRMAGFRVAWANEFIPAAADTYRANHPETVLDTRDIRKVQPADILQAIGTGVGDIDLFDGSPPCASFSTAGNRDADWGKVKKYSDTEQRTDDLFFEYARLVRGLQPKTFVAENVSGLVKGTAKGYFKRILAELRGCGYRVEARLLDAQWLGVPQSRQRLIFVGVRNDIGKAPAFPSPLPYRYSVRDAIPWIARAQYGADWRPADAPAPTVSASMTYNPETAHQGLELVEAETDISRFAIGKEWDRIEKRKLTIAELKRICAFPDDFVLTGTYSQQWERLGRAVPPVMMAAIANAVKGIL